MQVPSLSRGCEIAPFLFATWSLANVSSRETSACYQCLVARVSSNDTSACYHHRVARVTSRASSNDTPCGNQHFREIPTPDFVMNVRIQHTI